MTDDTDFCAACGASVGKTDQYCPACGIPVAGRQADEEMQAAYKSAVSSNISWAGVMLFIASIPSLVMGIYMIVDNTQAAQLLIDMYDAVNVNFADLAEAIKDYGIIFLAIGLLGIVGSVFCYLHKYWWFVLIITLVVLLVGVASFIGIFLGFLALWFVISSRSGFLEYQQE